jgi:4-amino-4-deoxy-L-arabinose transferase-like glycosyltransferase
MTRARLEFVLLLLAAVAIHAPFLNQAFQLDDAYYLAGAHYVQFDPAHPWLTSYVFLGEQVDMRGHPHPPFVVWFLGVLLAIHGHVAEKVFHAAYLGFTLLAAASMYLLARRFTRRPALAALLFLAVPAFVVHANGLESDIPFLALWMAAAAAFVYAVERADWRLAALAGAFLALASLAAYQAIFLVPVLAFYAWQRKRGWWPALAVCTVPFVVVGGYQLYQRLASGALPAAVLLGHFQHYQLQSLTNKVRNVLALTGHLGWLLFPPLAFFAFRRLGDRLGTLAGALTGLAVLFDRSPLFWLSFGVGVVVFLFALRGARDRDPDTAFLCAWIVLFFSAALVVFFAGAARYLLPIAAPVAILAVRAFENRPRWLWAAFALQLGFSLALAASHYQQSNAYREFVRELEPKFAGHKVWINGEWGLQYYGQQAGARPLMRNQEVQPGDWVLSSLLGYPIPYSTPGGDKLLVVRRAVTPGVPLRLIALNSQSAFSTISFGVRPFDVRALPTDLLTAETVAARPLDFEFAPMGAPNAGSQIVSGFYEVEAGQWRWMSGEGVMLLRRPAGPSQIVVRFAIPDAAPARRLTVAVDGIRLASRTFPGPGTYTLEIPAPEGTAPSARLAISVDKTFTPPGDKRRLGVIVNAAGFRALATPPR